MIVSRKAYATLLNDVTMILREHETTGFQEKQRLATGC